MSAVSSLGVGESVEVQIAEAQAAEAQAPTPLVAEPADREPGPDRPPRATVPAVVDTLHRAAVAVRHHVEQAVLREADLSWTGYAVLVLACERCSVESRAAAAAVGVSPGTLTGVVRTLETKKLLRRVPHRRDGRFVLLEPTPVGRRLARRLAPRVAVAGEHAVACLDGGERSALAGLLGRLTADLSGHHSPCVITVS